MYIDCICREHEERVKPLHLKKVAAGLARALWDLSEAGVVHGYIRCRRLLLAAHDGDRMLVKLSGPTLRHYTQLEYVHSMLYHWTLALRLKLKKNLEGILEGLVLRFCNLL